MAEDSSADVFRPQMYLFGCELKSDKKEYKIEADDDDETEHQLSLKTVCLGAQAEDRFNMVEMEGMTFDGKMSKVQLAVLKPSVLPSLNLGGFEVTPPVTFRLKSGPGPVYISGQHFVSVKESDDEEDEDEEEEENNTSPMKRPSSSGKVPMPKKIKLDDDEDEDDDDDDDDEDDDDDDDDDDDEEDEIPQKKLKNTSVKTPNTGAEAQGKKAKAASKPNGSPDRSAGPAGKPQAKSPKGGKENPAGGTPKTPSVSDVKNKLTTDVKEGKPLPKTEQKFENFARSCFKISDKNVIKELWTFVQTLKSGKK
ncbi:nucleophosmin 1b isoform X2 [Paramormyrops kingsleyae]|uniref:Nucleophosmin n=1 Tax=Paramormyrops kingsleyae TaxID=1676925 RepID=A0A3B3Q8M4_9TELE|nr:nucleophosmin-like isoform X2 [Paramormyrops kingsleyae]